MTTYSANHQFPIPEDGQLNWDDEIRETITSIDTLLKGIDEGKITKDVGKIGSLNVSTAATIASDTPLQLGDNGQFTAEYDSTNGVTAFRDSSLTTAEDYLTFTHGSGGAITTNRPLETSSGGIYATESYADSTANTTVNKSKITPTSVDTGSVTATDYNGLRLFSSFTSSSTPLQDALNWSDANNGAVFVDGQFDTSETNVEIPLSGTSDPTKYTSLIGSPHWSEIHATSTTAAPLLTIPSGDGGYRPFFSGVSFYNDGSVTEWLYHDAGTGNGFTSSGVFENMRIQGFGGTYVITMENVYSTLFNNILMYNPGAGGIHLHNANASSMLNYRHIYGGPNGTPAIYITDSLGFSIYHPYIEDVQGVGIQIANGSRAMISGGYWEMPNADHQPGVQVGDAGQTEGNTNGTTKNSTIYHSGGMFQMGNTLGACYELRNVSTADIAGQHWAAKEYGLFAGDAGDATSANTTVNRAYLRSISFFDVGQHTAIENGADVNVVFDSGRQFNSAPTSQYDMDVCELAYGDGTGASGEDEIFWRTAGDAPISRWTADGTIT